MQQQCRTKRLGAQFENSMRRHKIPNKLRIKIDLKTDHESYVIADKLSTVAPVERANKREIVIASSRAIRRKIKTVSLCI